MKASALLRVLLPTATTSVANKVGLSGSTMRNLRGLSQPEPSEIFVNSRSLEVDQSRARILSRITYAVCRLSDGLDILSSNGRSP